MRKCKNFIDSYLHYTRALESPTSYHTWCAISVISACLRRKTWINMGHFNIYPNMYIVLVGPPGKCKKSVAINASMELIEDYNEIKISADSITREALIQDIKKSETQIQVDINNEQRIQFHSSVTIVSKELSVFLGEQNQGLLSLLTDLYDCPNKWEYKTKNKGIDTCYGIWLSLLGASTPTWLVGSISTAAIGGGFTSRVIFIVEDKERHKNPFPFLTKEDLVLREELKSDLEKISIISGEMTLSSEAFHFVEDWYRNNEHGNMDSRFAGYYERKQLHLLKVAQVLSASESSKRIIEINHVKGALALLDKAEVKMKGAFGAAGRSTVAADIDEILQTIIRSEKISKEQLMRATWMNIHPTEFDVVIKSLQDMNQIKVTIGETDGKVYYTPV